LHKNSQIRIYILILFILVSCSPKRSNRMLSFFFDGVPLKDSVQRSVNGRSFSDSLKTDIFRANPIVSNSGFIVHLPYQEKKCLSCHDEKSKSELRLPQPDLCYSCHSDFSSKYKYVHGPVSSGYCTNCHNAHMSKEKNLLTRTGQQICLLCHDSGLLLKNETHKNNADSDCTLCHNPHGGENRYILNRIIN
jgi:predicted CXXCH cytochrome family protein